MDSELKILRNHNIRSISSVELLYRNIMMHRLVDMGIRVEGVDGTCVSSIENKSVAYGVDEVAEVLRKYDAAPLNDKVLKTLNLYVNNFERLSSSDRIEVVKIFDINKSKTLNLFEISKLSEAEEFAIAALKVRDVFRESIIDK